MYPISVFRNVHSSRMLEHSCCYFHIPEPATEGATYNTHMWKSPCEETAAREHDVQSNAFASDEDLQPNYDPPKTCAIDAAHVIARPLGAQSSERRLRQRFRTVFMTGAKGPPGMQTRSSSRAAMPVNSDGVRHLPTTSSTTASLCCISPGTITTLTIRNRSSEKMKNGSIFQPPPKNSNLNRAPRFT